LSSCTSSSFAKTSVLKSSYRPSIQNDHTIL
jgi:hypothetical protein